MSNVTVTFDTPESALRASRDTPLTVPLSQPETARVGRNLGGAPASSPDFIDDGLSEQSLGPARGISLAVAGGALIWLGAALAFIFLI